MIKFRVWDKEHKRMLNIETLALSFSPKGVLTSIYTYGPDFSNDPEIIGDDEPDLDSVILEQFTGLTDVNGKEIYEGDIIVSKPTEPKYEPLKIGLVKRSKARAGWCYETATATGEYNIWTSGKYRTYEVIGNIHANPELLED